MAVYRYAGKKGATYFIDYYRDGKRVREAAGPNKKEAQELLGKRLNEIRQEKLFGIKMREEVLFEDFAGLYKTWASHRRSPTFGYNLEMFKRHFAGKHLHEITEKDIDDFIMVRRDTPTRRGDKIRSGDAVNREMNDLSPIFTLAVRRGLIDKNPCAGHRRLPESKGRLRFLTPEEAAALLEVARRSRSRDMYLIILLALETGMRRGEIFNLQWEDIDQGRGQIWVRESKNGDARHIPMRPRVKDALQRHPRKIDSSYLFPGRKEITRASTGMRDTFMDFLQRAGILDFHFHDLRHTFASHLVMNGVDLFTVAKLLGHRGTKMTMRYSHLSPGYLQGAVNQLPEWVSIGQKMDRNEEAAC